MRYRKLGSTGLEVSVIGVGTWQLGGEWAHNYSQPEVDAILDQAAECGMNLIDTAECYGDHLSERFIGDYLSRRDRSRWIVATKFGHIFHDFMRRTDDYSVAGAERQLEASLRALRIDAIDLYQFHSGPDPAFQNQELWSMLERQKKAGKIRHIGISIRGAGSELQARGARAVGAEALQVIYNRLNRRAEQEFFPIAEKENLGILARVPLASGLLSGKYKPGAAFAGNDYRATVDQQKLQREIEEAEQIRRTELPKGVSMAQWALAWCLRENVVSTVIPGCKDAAQVRANAEAGQASWSARF